LQFLKETWIVELFTFYNQTDIADKMILNQAKNKVSFRRH